MTELRFTKASNRKEITNLNDGERKIGTVRSTPHGFVDDRVPQAGDHRRIDRSNSLEEETRPEY